jgi:hypothetical protein
LTDDLAFLVLGRGRLSAGLRLERAYWKENHDSSKQYKANHCIFFSTKSMFYVSSPLFADASDIPGCKINLQHRRPRRFRPCHGSARVASQLDTGFVQPYRENFPAQEWRAGTSPMSARLMTSLTRAPFGSAQPGQVQRCYPRERQPGLLRGLSNRRPAARRLSQPARASGLRLVPQYQSVHGIARLCRKSGFRQLLKTGLPGFSE